MTTISAKKTDLKKVRNIGFIAHIDAGKTKLRLAMVVNGVDLNGGASCMLSTAHSADDLANTAEAFRASLAMLKDDGEI